jgi:5-methylcytosine-specific restriction protein A
MINYNFHSLLKNHLENSFYSGFDIDVKSQEKCIVSFTGTNLQLFNLEVKFKGDVRLTILLHPEKYSAKFVSQMSQSTYEQRKKFISIWNSIGSKFINLSINNEQVNQDAFLNNKSIWNSFFIKFTKAPICEDTGSQSITDSVLNFIHDIITMVLSLVDFEIEGFSEGKLSKIEVNKYERNPVNRRICLLAKGYVCAVCGFDFQQTYGNIGKDYIEVHHTIQVSEMEADYIVKPLEELVPLCSNCHSMIHRTKPMLSVEFLKNEYLNKKRDSSL